MTTLAPSTLDTAVGTVEVHAGGEGGPAPLLYLHSAQGEGPGLTLLEELADTRRVAVPLFPGFGTSEGLDRIEDIEDPPSMCSTSPTGWVGCAVTSWACRSAVGWRPNWRGGGPIASAVW